MDRNVWTFQYKINSTQAGTECGLGDVKRLSDWCDGWEKDSESKSYCKKLQITRICGSMHVGLPICKEEKIDKYVLT